MSFTRYVAQSKEWGIYLGSFMGLGFWSKLDPAGQDSCCVFASPEEFWDHAKTWDAPPPKDTKLIQIVCVHTDYATIEECVNAGIPRWEVLK